jgi:ribosome-associated protein
MPQESRGPIPITPTWSLDPAELSEEFSRSPGPGGQNVNKVETAVTLRFDAARWPAVPEAVRARLLALAGNRLTNDGVLVIHAHRFRSREANREDALARLVALLKKAAVPPKPRRATRPTLASKQRRLDGKRREGEKKRRRGAPRDEE